jgi:hypothetical protein
MRCVSLTTSLRSSIRPERWPPRPTLRAASAVWSEGRCPSSASRMARSLWPRWSCSVWPCHGGCSPCPRCAKRSTGSTGCTRTASSSAACASPRSPKCCASSTDGWSLSRTGSPSWWPRSGATLGTACRRPCVSCRSERRHGNTSRCGAGRPAADGERGQPTHAAGHPDGRGPANASVADRDFGLAVLAAPAAAASVTPATQRVQAGRRSPDHHVGSGVF